MSNEDKRQNLIRFYLEKSSSAFDAAKLLAREKSLDACVNRLYYSCFYIVNALLIKNLDVRAKTHSGIKSTFNNHFVRTEIVDRESGTFYSTMMETRNENDYGDFITLKEDYVLPLLSQTEEFINTIKKLIV